MPHNIVPIVMHDLVITEDLTDEGNARVDNGIHLLLIQASRGQHTVKFLADGGQRVFPILPFYHLLIVFARRVTEHQPLGCLGSSDVLFVWE